MVLLVCLPEILYTWGACGVAKYSYLEISVLLARTLTQYIAEKPKECFESHATGLYKEIGNQDA